VSTPSFTRSNFANKSRRKIWPARRIDTHASFNYISLFPLQRFRARFLCRHGRALAEDDTHLMLCAVVLERNLAGCLRRTVHFNRRHAATQARGVLDLDVVARPPVAIDDLVLAPAARDTRLDPELLAAQAEAEDEFQPRAIHPTGRACVPSPTAASRVRPDGIDI